MCVRPDHQRLFATIFHQEPDRVPLAKLHIGKPIKEQLHPP
jgi:hypothetical protein